jgi:hypothetical protein
MENKFLSAVKMLVAIKEDYQFDTDHSGYLGFINVGADLWVGDDLKGTWSYIVSRPDLFEPIFEELGLVVEGRLDLDETVFTQKIV